MSLQVAGQWVVIYGPAHAPRVYATVYSNEELVIACGYARRQHPSPRDDVRALPARSVPVDATTT